MRTGKLFPAQYLSTLAESCMLVISGLPELAPSLAFAVVTSSYNVAVALGERAAPPKKG